MYELRSKKQLSIKHRVYNTQNVLSVKVRAEAKEMAEQRSYNAKYRSQIAAFRWVLLILTEDHDIGSREAQKLYHSVLWSTVLVIFTNPVPKLQGIQVKNRKPTRCHLLFYCTSYRLNMFRALLCTSSGPRDYNVDNHIGHFVLGLL